MSIKEMLRSAFLGFMLGLLYLSGMPIELVILFAIIILLFMHFKNKIRPIIDNYYNHSSILSKVPLNLRPIVTFIIIILIFLVVKQIIYFFLNYFFGINFNVDEYLNKSIN